jgi:lipopolysaccharide transport system ATP-binding protein
MSIEGMGGAPPAISVEALSKEYVLGAREVNQSFREALLAFAASPFRRLRGAAGAAAPRGERFWALRDVTFDVRPGEVIGIIGRNGAGKSTLLKVLSRIVEPTSGRAVIHGRIASLLEVGTGFHPELSGRENIYLNGAILGMKHAEIRRRFDEIVEFAEIDRFLDTPVKRYSSGMYVRLAFSVAAHLEPEILIVDEVLAVGDAVFQKKCLGKMQDVTRGGRTVLFVSHNLAAVASLCERVVHLERGRVVFDGPTDVGVPRYVASTMPSSDLLWPLEEVRRERSDLQRAATLVAVEGLPAQRTGFRFREPLRFTVTWRANAAVDDLVVVLNLDDINGTRLVTFEAETHRMGIVPEPGRTYTMELVVPDPPLSPGRYLLSTSLYSGHHWYDYVRQFGSFEVSTLTHGTGEYLITRPGQGLVHLPGEWRLVSDLPSVPTALEPVGTTA